MHQAKNTIALASNLLFVLAAGTLIQAQDLRLPNLDEAIASKEDLWTEAALRQPNGPSYEFFRDLIPPLHYVNTDFRHYPIVLSAPNARVKARLISNGSAINARANTRSWNEPGTPALFRVGNDELAFGEFLQRIEGPKFADGYLPIVQLRYQHASGIYSQETFAATSEGYASNAVTLSQFSCLADGTPGMPDAGRMVVRLESPAALKVEEGRILDENGEILVWFDRNWKWDDTRHVLVATFTGATKAAVAIATVPMPSNTSSPLIGDGYDVQRQLCTETWKAVLKRGMDLEIPEPYVNNAWRSLIIANFALINGDRMHYSAGNQYDKMYEHEGSDTALSMMLYGYEADMRRLMTPLLDFTRKGLEYHQAGHKLDDVCRYYWQTRDAEFVNSLRARWQKEVDRLANNRSSTNGLYPREQYCGDIDTLVFSLNSNTKGWRALHDMAAMLEALGEKKEAARLRIIATDFRKDILAAVDKSGGKDLSPPFIPNALFGEEQPYDNIATTRMGNYWNVMINTIIGSEVFGQNSDTETGMLQYCQQHGGLFMGLVRAHPWPAFWVSTANLNPLYTLRYAQILLRRDEPDRALASFYGMLAAGLTPNTFIGGEGCAIQPLDKWGRQFYCPPNSAGNAFLLQTLRRLLVQEWDLDEDGEPDTLRLLFATPRLWLEDGKSIKVERAPTAFGPVSVLVQSKLKQGEILASVDLPARNRPRQTLLRIRLPVGWRVISAQTGDHELKVDEHGMVNLSSLKGRVAIRFEAKQL